MLYDHQKTGICFLYNKKNVILADDMGLGKTVQALFHSHIVLMRGKADKHLVVCPTNLLTTWLGEFKEWLNVKPYVYHGPNRDVRKALKHQHIITTYDTLKSDLDIFGAALPASLLVTCDEAHNLRNDNSGRTIAVRKLGRSRTVLLTGTPIENRPDDLYSLLNLIRPDLTGTKREFFARYIKMKTVQIITRDGRVFYKQKPVGVKPGALHILRSILHRVMLRREKSMLKDFPTLTIQHHPYELDRKTDRLYRMVLDCCEELELGLGSTITRLRQVLDGIIKTQESPREYEFFLSAKAKLLEELLQGRSGRIIVWFNFIEPLMELAAVWKDRFPIHIYTGKMSLRERDRVLESWKSSNSGVLFATIKGAGTGLNLTEASDAIFYSFEWTPAANEQACNRIHRIKQKNKCTIHYLYGRNCLEMVILAMLMRKKKTASSIVDLKKMQEDEMDEIYNYTLKLIDGETDIKLLKGLEDD